MDLSRIVSEDDDQAAIFEVQEFRSGQFGFKLGHKWIDFEISGLDDHYDTQNVIVKGLLLMPFVSESLMWHESVNKKENPFAPKPDSEFVNFIENEQSTDERKGLKAFHFVTQYKSNLEEPQPTSLESFFI